jgi:uncharacterized protein (TIGR00269 family)
MKISRKFDGTIEEIFKELGINEKTKGRFIRNFEKKVYKTVSDFNLIKKRDKVAVACSGGKDSTAVLNILSKKFNVEAVAIDEGIKKYRGETLSNLKKFCKVHKIKLKVLSFRDEFGMPVGEIIEKVNMKPCTVCGILRRYLLNKQKDYDVIATGHNMDDECQSILMNMLKNKLFLSARLGPKTGIVADKKFVQRVKPLYFCTEKEVVAYVVLKEIKTDFSRCPYANTAFRETIRSELNVLEKSHKGYKLNFIKSFLKQLPKLKEKYKSEGEVRACEKCREPSKEEVCMACQITEKLKD